MAETENDDVGQIFINELEEIVKHIYQVVKEKTNRFKHIENMIFTEEDEKNVEAATVCHICEKELGEDKVIDHCHLTGRYRGAAPNDCNLKYKIPTFIPVYLHNLSGYDSHLFIKNLRTAMKMRLTAYLKPKKTIYRSVKR